MTVTVRPATIADARAIATVRVRSWRAAYEGLIDQAVLDRMDIDREAARRGELWEEYHADPRGGDLVAEGEGAVVGWAAYGRSLDDDLPANGQLYAIYALPEEWSSGIGHALLTDAERRLAEAGFDLAHLWVLDGNTRAASFYERHGWREDGAEKDDDRLIGGANPQTLHERRRVKRLR